MIEGFLQGNIHQILAATESTIHPDGWVTIPEGDESFCNFLLAARQNITSPDNGCGEVIEQPDPVSPSALSPVEGDGENLTEVQAALENKREDTVPGNQASHPLVDDSSDRSSLFVTDNGLRKNRSYVLLDQEFQGNSEFITENHGEIERADETNVTFSNHDELASEVVIPRGQNSNSESENSTEMVADAEDELSYGINNGFVVDNSENHTEEIRRELSNNHPAVAQNRSSSSNSDSEKNDNSPESLLPDQSSITAPIQSPKVTVRGEQDVLDNEIHTELSGTINNTSIFNDRREIHNESVTFIAEYGENTFPDTQAKQDVHTHPLKVSSRNYDLSEEKGKNSVSYQTGQSTDPHALSSHQEKSDEVDSIVHETQQSETPVGQSTSLTDKDLLTNTQTQRFTAGSLNDRETLLVTPVAEESFSENESDMISPDRSPNTASNDRISTDQSTYTKNTSNGIANESMDTHSQETDSPVMLHLVPLNNTTESLAHGTEEQPLSPSSHLPDTALSSNQEKSDEVDSIVHETQRRETPVGPYDSLTDKDLLTNTQTQRFTAGSSDDRETLLVTPVAEENFSENETFGIQVAHRRSPHSTSGLPEDHSSDIRMVPMESRDTGVFRLDRERLSGITDSESDMISPERSPNTAINVGMNTDQSTYTENNSNVIANELMNTHSTETDSPVMLHTVPINNTTESLAHGTEEQPLSPSSYLPDTALYEGQEETSPDESALQEGDATEYSTSTPRNGSNQSPVLRDDPYLETEVTIEPPLHEITVESDLTTENQTNRSITNQKQDTIIPAFIEQESMEVPIEGNSSGDDYGESITFEETGQREHTFITVESPRGTDNDENSREVSPRISGKTGMPGETVLTKDISSEITGQTDENSPDFTPTNNDEGTNRNPVKSDSGITKSSGANSFFSSDPDRPVENVKPVAVTSRNVNHRNQEWSESIGMVPEKELGEGVSYTLSDDAEEWGTYQDTLEFTSEKVTTPENGVKTESNQVIMHDELPTGSPKRVPEQTLTADEQPLKPIHIREEEVTPLNTHSMTGESPNGLTPDGEVFPGNTLFLDDGLTDGDAGLDRNTLTGSVVPHENTSGISHTLEINRPTAQYSEGIDNQVVDQVVKSVRFLFRQDHPRMIINLEPPRLGKMRIELTTEGSDLSVKLIVESKEVKQIIESSMSHLREDLQHEGVHIKRFHVNVGMSSNSDSQAHHHNSYMTPQVYGDEWNHSDNSSVTKETVIEPSGVVMSPRNDSQLVDIVV